MTETNEVTIIGAGIVGICSALSLLERGVAVRLIDRAGPAEGASYGNAGVISPWSSVPQSLPGIFLTLSGAMFDPLGPLSIRWRYLPRFLPWALRFLSSGRLDKVEKIADAMDQLNRPNVDLYRRHLSGTNKEHLLQECFYVQAQRSPLKPGPDSLSYRLREKRSAPMELVDGKRLREIEPALSKDYQSGLVIRDQARALHPGELGQALAEKAKKLGAEFLRHDVQAIRPNADGGWLIETRSEPLTAEKLLVSAGAWSTKLLEPLGIHLPLAFERGYHLECRDPGIDLNHSVMDLDKKFVASSMSSGIRSAGTAEFADIDAPPDDHRVEMLKTLTKAMLPDINIDNTKGWMGVRPSFPDSLPCIGALPGFDNLHIAFGHSHYGLGMAPKTGEIIADLIADHRPNIDLTPYSPDRFS